MPGREILSREHLDLTDDPYDRNVNEVYRDSDRQKASEAPRRQLDVRSSSTSAGSAMPREVGNAYVVAVSPEHASRMPAALTSAEAVSSSGVPRATSEENSRDVEVQPQPGGEIMNLGDVPYETLRWFFKSRLGKFRLMPPLRTSLQLPSDTTGC